MKLLETSASALAALTLVGCGSPLKTAAITTGRLDCPTEQGMLSRVSAAADGKSCLYKIGAGTEVVLRLIPIGIGGPTATLAAVEQELRASAKPLPATPGTEPPAASDSAKAAALAQAQAEVDSDQDENAVSSDEKTAEWDEKSISAKVDAKLREKGLDGPSSSDGDSTQVDLPGIHITAGDNNANVRVGPIHVNANGDGATVRSFEAVRMRGEAFSNQRRGLRAMLIYAGDTLNNGYKFVGYSASGPQTGPLVVAVVKSRSEGGIHGDIYGDIKRLVRRNGGT